MSDYEYLHNYDTLDGAGGGYGDEGFHENPIYKRKNRTDYKKTISSPDFREVQVECEWLFNTGNWVYSKGGFTRAKYTGRGGRLVWWYSMVMYRKR